MTVLLSQPSRADETSLMVAFQSERTSPAFEALYRMAAPGLLRWIDSFVQARRIAIDPCEALQDTFVNVYRYAGTFRPDAAGGFRAWARTIATNAVRRARRRPVNAALLFTDIEGPIEGSADRRSSPMLAAVDLESSQAMRAAFSLFLLHYAAAFDTLKSRDQEALRLVEVEGLTYAEVGAALGVGRSNTKMIVFRARQRLRAALEVSLCVERAGMGTSGATSEESSVQRLCA